GGRERRGRVSGATVCLHGNPGRTRSALPPYSPAQNVYDERASVVPDTQDRENIVPSGSRSSPPAGAGTPDDWSATTTRTGPAVAASVNSHSIPSARRPM